MLENGEYYDEVDGPEDDDAGYNDEEFDYPKFEYRNLDCCWFSRPGFDYLVQLQEHAQHIESMLWIAIRKLSMSSSHQYTADAAFRTRKVDELQLELGKERGKNKEQEIVISMKDRQIKELQTQVDFLLNENLELKEEVALYQSGSGRGSNVERSRDGTFKSKSGKSRDERALEAYELKSKKDQSYEDIARIMHISVSTAQQYVSRGRLLKDSWTRFQYGHGIEEGTIG